MQLHGAGQWRMLLPYSRSNIAHVADCERSHEASPSDTVLPDLTPAVRGPTLPLGAGIPRVHLLSAIRTQDENPAGQIA